ncbi:glycerol kinase GlpK [Thalassobaculum sp.]|uniref:glycerol kinase GlpK n=1 Tax=Thalassobaculum sp. TaxID=2022740 RepID=UPI0032EBD63A
MAGTQAIVAIDQGTTSSRAIAFRTDGSIIAVAQREFRQIYPASGWVEHDPEEIWSTAQAVTREAIDAAESAGLSVAAIGITNQRETTIVWDRGTGKAIHNAIVWQDRRTAGVCARLRDDGLEDLITERTGLLLDPYFSATKVAWILDHVDGARDRAARGELAFGTVDSFLMWRLTGGRRHVTDATNAARTNLCGLTTSAWDDRLLEIFQVPASMLPEILDCAAEFGETDPSILGKRLPVLGIAGDQQAAAVGQACFRPGDIKSTYGTGCFVILNTGNAPVRSSNRLLSTLCYRVAGRNTYALEGAIFVSGAVVQWLRDGLGVIEKASETEALARSVDDTGGVYLVPAFTGLGAPFWDAEARGAMFGLTRDTGRAHLARAALESVAYQTRDLFRAMAEDGVKPETLRVDGGMAANDWLMQFLSDVLSIPVERPTVTETTALGAAALAALQAGIYSSLDDVAASWALDRRFEPDMAPMTRRRLLSGWDSAVARTRIRIG